MMAVRWRCVLAWMAFLMLLAGCGNPEPTTEPSPATATTIALSPTESRSPPEDTAVSPTLTMSLTEEPSTTARALPPTPGLATSGPSPAASLAAPSPTPVSLEGQILFSIYPDGDIAVMNGDGSDRRLLLDERIVGKLLTDRFATWQSGGKAVSYVVDDFERVEIWLMPVEGGPGQSLVADVASVTSHSWSPDGERLAFVSVGYEICILNRSDQTITKLAVGDLRDARDPDWSPDGLALAFSASDGHNQDIYVVSAEGTGLVRITNHPAPDKHPDWSPDGTELVFSSNRRSPRFSDIYMLDVDLGTEDEGNQAIQLTAEDRLETRPNWSPDGSWIVYLSHELGAGHGIMYALEVNSQTRIQVCADNIYHSPRWQP
jgi:Tol biopolymer transport system component